MPNGSDDVDGVDARRGGPPKNCVDLDVLRNSSGIMALISQRKYDGEITFALFREFERGGSVARTAFVPATMSVQYLEMVKLAIERANELKARGNLPYPVKGR
jgi:hypothetical protein